MFAIVLFGPFNGIFPTQKLHQSRRVVPRCKDERYRRFVRWFLSFILPNAYEGGIDVVPLYRHRAEIVIVPVLHIVLSAKCKDGGTRSGQTRCSIICVSTLFFSGYARRVFRERTILFETMIFPFHTYRESWAC